MPNIEIKATYKDLESAKNTAIRLGAKYLSRLHQIDTYYETKKGRLKLREINSNEAQLIPYFKDYEQGPMKSTYALLPVENPEITKSILDKILGTVCVVDKSRDVYLLDNIRIHLDSVEKLGSFIEFEAVYEGEDKRPEEERKVAKLMEEFQISKEQLLDKSYIDYLL